MIALVGSLCFISGLIVGAVVASRSIKIQAGNVLIEARSVREVKAIMDAFKRDEFLMDQMKGTIQ